MVPGVQDRTHCGICDVENLLHGSFRGYIRFSPRFGDYSQPEVDHKILDDLKAIHELENSKNLRRMFISLPSQFIPIYFSKFIGYQADRRLCLPIATQYLIKGAKIAILSDI